MRNQNTDWDDSYDYSPNELAELSANNPKLYREVVSSNLDNEDNIERWERRNKEWAQDCLAQQRANRKR